MRNYIFLLMLIPGIAVLSSCGGSNPDDPSFNVFSIEDDKALGKDLDSVIMANPNEYPVLSEAQYPGAYQFMYDIRDRILNAGEVFYDNEFVWKIRIIENDTVLNAFATPGGYTYYYTGMLKFLDQEHALAGVMAHEMAHADRRHATDRLTKIYGVSLLLEVIFGSNENLLKDILGTLVTLKFSRDDERESDEYSVIYLCPTYYQADGAAEFFEEMQGQPTPPEFLSTHPDPGDRVEDIRLKEQMLGCDGTNTFDQRYANFKASLP